MATSDVGIACIDSIVKHSDMSDVKNPTLLVLNLLHITEHLLFKKTKKKMFAFICLIITMPNDKEFLVTLLNSD